MVIAGPIEYIGLASTSGTVVGREIFSGVRARFHERERDTATDISSVERRIVHLRHDRWQAPRPLTHQQ